MYQHILSSSCKIVFIGCLMFMFSTCSDKQQSSSEANTTFHDSVNIWINQGKTSTLPKEKRFEILNKAYQKANITTVDSLKTKYFSALSLAYLTLNDSLLFRKINFKARKLAKENKDSVYLAEAHWDLAGFLGNHAVKDSSYYHYNEAQKIYNTQNDRYSSARMLYNMARIQSSISDYTSSEITTIKAIELFKSLDEKYKNLYLCYNLLGNVAGSLKEYTRALEYHNEALFYLRKEHGNQLLELSTTNNIAVLYQKQGKHREAISYLSKVITYDSIYFKDTKLYAKALINLGYNKLEINDTSKLPYFFNKAYTILDSIQDIGGKSSATYYLSQYYLYQKDSTAALFNLQKSKNFAKQSNDNDRWLDVLRMLPKVSPKNAAEYNQEYVMLRDSLQQQERKIRDKFARIRFETDEVNAENQLINAENELLAKQKQLWAGVAAILLTIGAATFIIINQRTKNRILKFREKQQASNQEIFNLLLAQNQNIEEGKQMEQKRISEELHDGVLGKMLGARMMLIGLNKKIDEEAIAERAKAISILQGVEGEVRSISHELSHAAYQKINNFILSIQDLLKTIQSSSKIEINFKYAETLDWDALSGDIKINLYRMVQEILQNSVKHSECTVINLNFVADVEFLKITIADNGKGFVIKKGGKGIGMRNITSRIKKVDGTWDIDSKISEGTTVKLVIPLVLNENEDGTEKVLVQEDF